MKKALEEDETEFAFTMDTWTSANNDSYTSLAVYYMSKNTSVHCCCLQIHNITGSHRSDRLSEELKTSLTNWGLPLPSNDPIMYLVKCCK